MSTTTNKQALREAELLELNELLRGKVKQLEEKIWDTDQLRKVHSEKSFELEGKVRELEARNQKDFVWRGQEIGRLNDEVDELKEKLQVAEKRIAELEAREVKIPELKMLSDYLREVTFREREDIILGVKLELHRNLKAAGISVKGE